MADIYRGTSKRAYLDIYGGTATAMSVQLTVGSSDPVSLTPTQTATTGDETDKWYVYLGLQYTNNDDVLKLVWSFTIGGENAVVEQYYNVVTPYVTVDEIKAALELPAGITDDKLQAVERRVRYIIDESVGHGFGKYTATKIAVGRGDRDLYLPDRLISFSSITGAYIATDLAAYEIRDDGNYLGRAPSYPDGDWVFTNVIAAPGESRSGWLEDAKYSITGTWGWETVPGPVKEAALILIEQRLCPDTEYADRYIEDVNYADSSFSFNSLAWSGTGNFVADKLLGQFARISFTVI